MKQTLGRNRVSPLMGVLFVFLTVAIICLLYIAMYALWYYTGFRYGSIAVWILGFALAAFILFRYIRCYEYDLDSFELNVYRLYGKRRRLMTTVNLRSLIDMGAPGEMRSRHPGASLTRAVVKKSGLEPFCLVYSLGGRLSRLILMPDAELLKALKAINQK